MRGHLRFDVTNRPLRFWTLTRYPNYSIVYLPETVPLETVAVMHGKRDLRRILKNSRSERSAVHDNCTSNH